MKTTAAALASLAARRQGTDSTVRATAAACATALDAYNVTDATVRVAYAARATALDAYNAAYADARVAFAAYEATVRVARADMLAARAALVNSIGTGVADDYAPTCYLDADADLKAPIVCEAAAAARTAQRSTDNQQSPD